VQVKDFTLMISINRRFEGISVHEDISISDTNSIDIVYDIEFDIVTHWRGTTIASAIYRKHRNICAVSPRAESGAEYTPYRSKESGSIFCGDADDVRDNRSAIKPGFPLNDSVR
jgi:hypothetical protein